MNITLLNDKKSIKQLVEVDTNKSILEFITKELDANEYNFIVTSENLSVAKKAMAKLNKSKDFINTFCKDKISDESINIDLLKSNKKEYVELIDAKREKIKKDVEVLEREAKDSITKELSIYTDNAIKEAKLRFDFTDVNTADLIKLGSVTASGSLKKATTETIDGRVLACKSKQDKYDMRLMQLENESHKAGLEATLTITHIQGIIYLDDDTEYQTKLNELIGSEIQRQNIVKENLQKEADAKAQRDAHQDVLDGQNRINSIFNDIANRSSLDVDSKIELISNYEYHEFSQLEGFARAKGQMVISELNNFKDEMLKKQNLTPKKEIPVVHETIPHTQEEKSEIVSEVAENVEDGKKVVLIDVKLQFKVKDSIHDSKIVGKVHKMLTDAGFIESLMSVKVV
jgi:hypothetical protein